MIKKLLSFVALSATLIAPAFADEFGGLDYYQDDSLPIMITQPINKPQYQVQPANTMKWAYGRTTIDDAIFQAIYKKNWGELELLLETDGAFPLDVIATAILLMQGNNIDAALKVLEQEDTQSRNWITEWEHWYAHNADDDKNDYTGRFLSGSSAGGAMPPDDDKNKKNNKNTTSDTANQMNGKSFSEAEKIADRELLSRGWQKSPLKIGDGVRYFDGKGNSVQINKGYANSNNIHGGPYVKYTHGSQVIRIPLKGNPIGN